MGADIDRRARHARRELRRGVHSVRPDLQPSDLARAVSSRRRRQRLATSAVVPIVVVAAVVLFTGTPGADAPPAIGPVPTDTSPRTPAPTTPAVPQPDTSDTPATPQVDITDELPPAPIAPRDGHTVVWAGTQLLVWGGSARIENPATALDDGAAYTPDDSSWRPLPPAPDDGATGHVAVWTGEQMVVAGGHGQGSRRTVRRYDPDPDTDTWTLGSDAPFDITRDTSAAVWTGNRLAVWTPGEGFGEYDPTADVWTERPEPPIDVPSQVTARTQALHASGSWLYASASDVRGSQLQSTMQTAVRHTDGTWDVADELGPHEGTMPEGGRMVDPQPAHLTVDTPVGLLAVSSISDAIPAALLDPDTGTWTDLAVPGIPSCEDYPPPLAIPTGAVIFNYCGPGAVFDADTREFTPLELPDSPPGSNDTTVWTDDTLLTYATACCYGSAQTLPQMGSWERPLTP